VAAAVAPAALLMPRSLERVLGPIMPSATSPFDAWKDLTARQVEGPK